MSALILNEQASTPGTPTSTKVKVYVDNTATPQMKFVDDLGTVRTVVDSGNTVTVANKTIDNSNTVNIKDANFSLEDDGDSTKKLLVQLSGQSTGTNLTIASAQSTSQTLNVPNITASDTVVTTGLAQTVSGLKTFGTASLLINNPAATFAYTLTSAAITAARVLNLPLTNQTETLAVKPQVAGVRVASPAGITNTSGLMLGLSNLQAGNIITPSVTGRVCITISGVVAQSTTLDGAFWHIRTGTGTAPSNGGALTGTQTGGQQSMTFLTGVLKVPFCITSYMTGAALGTALWIDLVLAAVTGGTATMTEVMVSAFEF